MRRKKKSLVGWTYIEWENDFKYSQGKLSSPSIEMPLINYNRDSKATTLDGRKIRFSMPKKVRITIEQLKL